MSIVPYRVSGPGADQTQETRLFQVGGLAIRIDQEPSQSKARPSSGGRSFPSGEPGDPPGGVDLSAVGLVVWESAFVLADLLLQRSRFVGCWQDLRALDLGCGTGLVGIALALAGADAVLADLPHVTPLARRNIALNCRLPPHRAEVVDYRWGDPLSPLGTDKAPFDLVAGADIVYQEEHFPALLATLRALCAPHTLCYLAFRIRGRGEKEFEELLRSEGFAAEQIRTELLHEEYRSGTYKVLQVCRL